MIWGVKKNAICMYCKYVPTKITFTEFVDSSRSAIIIMTVQFILSTSLSKMLFCIICREYEPSLVVLFLVQEPHTRSIFYCLHCLRTEGIVPIYVWITAINKIWWSQCTRAVDYDSRHVDFVFFTLTLQIKCGSIGNDVQATWTLSIFLLWGR